MKVAMIAAMAKTNRVIGVNNDLPWKISKDFQYLKDVTRQKPLIMGRKTYESLPMKPLPGRANIILTRDSAYKAEGAHVFEDYAQALALAKTEAVKNGVDEIIIFGGQEIYQLALDSGTVDKIYLTEVEIQNQINGDAFFPEFDKNTFTEKSRKREEENGLFFDFVVYEKG